MKSFYIVIFLIFTAFAVGFYLLKPIYPDLDLALLEQGNLLLLIMTVIAFVLVKSNINNNPNAFVRGVYAGTLLKMLVLMVAVLVFVAMHADKIHKPSLFIVFGLYAVYAVVEAVYLSKLAKGPKP